MEEKNTNGLPLEKMLSEILSDENKRKEAENALMGFLSALGGHAPSTQNNQPQPDPKQEQEDQELREIIGKLDQFCMAHNRSIFAIVEKDERNAIVCIKGDRKNIYNKMVSLFTKDREVMNLVLDACEATAKNHLSMLISQGLEKNRR